MGPKGRLIYYETETYESLLGPSNKVPIYVGMVHAPLAHLGHFPSLPFLVMRWPKAERLFQHSQA